MRFRHYLTFSVVASNLLFGAAYTDWNQTTLNGDTITINYDTTATTPPTTLNPLDKSLSVTGSASVTVSGTAPSNACGYIACWSSSANIDGSGTLTFRISSSSAPTTPAFTITSGTLTTTAIINTSGTNLPSIIFEAQNGANLAFNNNLTINGDTNTTAIKTGTGSLNLGNGGKSTVKITGKLDLGGNSTINLGSGSGITGNIASKQQLDLTLAGANITGSVSQNGGSKLTLTMEGGKITQGVTSTASSNTISLTNNASILGNVSLSGTNTTSLTNATISGNLTLSGTNTAPITITSSTITGTINTNSAADFGTITGSTIGSMNHSGGTFDLILEGNTINSGITTGSNSGVVNITLKNTSNLKGSSTLGSNTSATLTMEDTSSGGNVTFASPKNTLEAKGTNNTLTSLTMQGGNGGNATSNTLKVTGKLSVNGNATLKGTNDIDFNDGKITGTLTTEGETTLDTNNSTSIGQGLYHSNGNLTANFNNSSSINGGIKTSGTGDTKAVFNGSSSLKGTSSFASTNNTLTLNDTSTITGNTSFYNKSTLKASNGTTITGQIITASGSATYTFGNTTPSAAGTTGATITGGIDTENGAIQTTANFNGSSILQNGTSTFHSNIDIIFSDTSKAISEKFKIEGNTTNITFQNKAEMQKGSITNNGGTANITFTDDSKMTNAEIKTTSGTTTLTANKNAQLSNQITQSGGTMNVTFKDQATFTGNITQTNGKSTILFDDATKMTGDISVRGGSTEITFTGTPTTGNPANIKGNIEAAGATNKVTFTAGTLLDGNLTLDGYDTINGNSKAEFTESRVTGNIQGYDTVVLNLTKTQVDGYVHQGPSANNAGMTGTFTDSKISGGFQGEKSNNTLTITNSQIEKGVKQIAGSLKITADKTVITGGFSGSNNSKNTVTMTKGSLEGGIKQDTGTLDFTSTETTITGGFSGTSNSNNTVKMTEGSLTGGISQNTGTLDFEAEGTGISGGFTGTNSDNTLLLINANFNDGDITQTGGTLKGDILSTNGLGNFKGTNSTNILEITHSDIKNIDQSGGGLTLTTDSNINGYIKGVSGSVNSISTRGSSITGEISQNTGSMSLQTFNTTAQNITMQNATFMLQADNTSATSLSLTDSTSTGTANAFHLTETFTQIRGTSSLIFTASTFDKDSILNEANATLSFTGSSVQSFSASSGTSFITLSNSTMKDFTGTRGTHSLVLSSKSNANTITQNMGSLSISASSESNINEDITAKGFATLSVSLSNSNAKKSILNTTGGEMVISAIDSKIDGDVKQQSAGTFSLSLTNSTIKGQYSQFEGISTVNSLNSEIQGGIELKNLNPSNLSFSQASKVSKGLSVEGGTVSFDLLGGSSIEGDVDTPAIKQVGGNLTGNLNRNSNINGDISFKDGVSKLYLYGNSGIAGNILAENNTTSILVDNSSINGNITINQGSFALIAQNNTTIQGNTNGDKSKIQIDNADFSLTVDSSSTFNGDITQTNNKQTIIVKQNSTLNGDITNTNTTSTIRVENATLKGSVTQGGGTLTLDLSNKGIITGNINLNAVNTTLSGLGMQNAINGSFTQNGGNLSGSMHGLTLTGVFTQIGGNSNATFIDSEFKSDTAINNADDSSLTFDHSTLRNYTTDGGGNNTLSLINNSTMNGTLTLKNQAQTLLEMDTSTLQGENDTAITVSGQSFLTLNTKNSTITGKITVETGGISGIVDNTDINGNIELTNTLSNISFINTSAITGDLTATGENSNNTIKFDNSSITGSVSQTEGTIDLDLSNRSSIGTNLIFTNTTATLTGSGVGNSIGGKFDSIDTILTGDASGLTLTGTFTQTNGSSNITFKNQSNFNGAVSISGATSSNINFSNQSGINNTISITNGASNIISLDDNSFINGKMTLTTTTATITASNNSTITGDYQTINSTATLSLSNSIYQGNITQSQGTLNLSGSNNSNFVIPNIFTIIGNPAMATTNINLNSNSSLTGNITATNSDLNLKLDLGSSINAAENPSTISLINSNFIVSAKNDSALNANITNTNDTNPLVSKTMTLDLQSGSVFNGTLDLKNINTAASINQSTFNSDLITVDNGELFLGYTNSTDGGTIQEIRAENTNITINANHSQATINNLTINGNELNLFVENSARLIADITLNGNTKATYTALTNGNLNVDTTIANLASTLTANIKGGILQGNITQEKGAKDFEVGDITLQYAGDYGGRWLVTDDSQVKSLSIENTSEAVESNAVLASPFQSPLSMVDFTTEKEDTQYQSRIGKAIINKPIVANGDPIPEAGEGRTYVRQLQVNEIKGNNGLFRIYADLGSNLADNILASKASGNHIIQVQYRAETFREIGSDRIVVAKVTDNATSVSFKGTQSEIGLTKYNTEIVKENAKDGNGYEWIIGQATPAGISYSSKILASILQNQYRTFMIEIDSLDRRMGDLKYINRDKGLWMRSYIGSNTKEATDFSISAQDDYYSIWGGFDFNSIGLTVHNYVGTFFNYTGINTESKDYSAKSSNIAFGFYNTLKAYSGFYADLLVKYIYTLSEFNISNYSLSKNSPKIDNHKFLLNAEIGYSFYYGEKGKSGYIQPQFQVTSGYIHKTDLSVIDASGETIQASIGRNFPVSVRAGAFWGQVFGEKIKSHIKFGTSFVYDVDSGGDLVLKDSSDQLTFQQEGDFRWVLSAHADFTFNDFFKMYTSFDTSFFGNYNTTYSFNIGLRFTFGRANNVVANVPMVYSPYTPPVIINDDKRTVPVVQKYTTQDIDQNYIGKPRKVESYIQGNPNPTYEQNIQLYNLSRQPQRDITDIVEIGAQP